MKTYSRESYCHLLEVALKKGYQVLGFLDGEDVSGGRIYLRHDVHSSLGPALELAAINRSLGLRGTFFLLLRSQSYNLFSPWVLDSAQRLFAHGQRLAFHYVAPSVLPVGDEELVAMILQDFEIVRRQLPEAEPVFSWHNPTPELINRGLSLQVPGLVNAYSTRFVKRMRYFSDSNMRHSVDEFETILSEEGHRALHLLFHPDHWIPGGASVVEILGATWQYIIRDAEREMRQNRVYQAVLADGMPDSVLQGFSQQWCRSTGSNAS
jgi:hypothetical protein